ncbi:hypothetical protein [Saccharopolyspora sp. NPDC002686]
MERAVLVGGISGWGSGGGGSWVTFNALLCGVAAGPVRIGPELDGFSVP